MSKYTKFDIFDVVILKSQSGELSGIILDYDFRWMGPGTADTEVFYEVFAGSERKWFRQSDVERIGQFLTPLHYDQEVMVKLGKGKTRPHWQGIVTGIAWEPEIDKWGYTVKLEDGRTVAVSEDEVQPLNLKSDYGQQEYQIVANEAKNQPMRIIGQEPKALLPGTPAPKTGVYCLIKPTGELTNYRVFWRQGMPLPRTEWENRSWILIHKSEQQKQTHL